MDADFEAGKIVYKETIRNTVEGVGHYEPLGIMRRSISCWSRGSEGAALRSGLPAARMCWTAAGRG